jgi:hypothetical protein
VDAVELAEHDLLGGLKGTANALVLQTDLLDEIAICQLGGGLVHSLRAPERCGHRSTKGTAMMAPASPPLMA